MAITDNLVSYFKLEDVSDSVGSNGLTNNGTVTFSSGKVVNGASFNGSSQWLSKSSPSGLPTGQGARTLAFWFKPASTITGFPVTYGTGSTYQAFKVGLDDSTHISIDISGTGQAFSIATPTMSSGNWYHFAVTLPGSSNVCTGYFNGASIGTATLTQTINTGSTFLNIGGYNGAASFNGMVDEVGIWSRALTPAEIAYLYNNSNGSQYPNLQKNTLGEYLGAGSGTTKGLYHLNGNSADYSGNSNNGTDTSVTYSLANGAFGQGAGYSNSSNSKTKLNTVPITGNNVWTVSLWAKKSSSNASVLWYWGTGASKQSVFLTYETGNNRFGLGAYAANLYYTYTMNNNTWYHLVLSYDQTNQYFYINGTLVSTQALNTLNIGTTAAWISRDVNDNAGTSWDGMIDEFIVENVVWTPEKIKKYYSFAKGRFGII